MDQNTYMACAVLQARKAFECDEVPIGAVLVDATGKIIARAYNRVEKKQSQLAHAELQVLAIAAKKLQRWRYSDLTLYVTLQPCVMCMGALILSRIGKVVYAAQSPLFGCNLDKLDWFGIYKESLPIVAFEKDEESVELLQKFFKKQRKMRHGS